MKNIKKEGYTLETLSTVVLSPREKEYFFVEEENNIIYPFYRYGIYEEYKEEAIQYYIPGSSIKGAVMGFNKKEKKRNHIMFDDILIKDKEDIGLYPLNKVQYVMQDKKTPKKIKIDTFFPNIRIEMLKANKKYKGEVFLQGSFKEYLEETTQCTKRKVEKFCSQINAILDMSKDNIEDKNREILNRLKENLKNVKDKIEQIKDEYYIFLGGYKGFLLSANFNDEMIENEKMTNDINEVSSAIYIDKEKNLPHGLVKIKLFDL